MDDVHPSTESTDSLILKWATLLRRLKFAGVAVLALEMLKPVSFVAGQLLWVADPVLQSLTGRSSRNCALFLEDRRSIERLLSLLEEQPFEPPN